jgi:hypothetical protein
VVIKRAIKRVVIKRALRKGRYVRTEERNAAAMDGWTQEQKGWKRGDGRSRSKRWMQHRDFPGGHPSQYYSGPKALNFRVLMGSGVVALV